jgi:hypothetical protein
MNMKRRKFFNRLGVSMLFGSVFTQKAISADTISAGYQLKDKEIQHMVIFNLPYEEGSSKAMKFLKDGKRILTGIPVVRNFQVFLQVSPKNDFQYGFSMVFTDQDDYKTYNDHPDHVDFVEKRWMKEVTDFLEIDFKAPQ